MSLKIVAPLGTPVSIGQKLASSDSFKSLFREGMGLVEAAASYLDSTGREESRRLPRIEAFSPDLVIISAGFDAHRLDPLANLKLVEADFAWATRKLMDIAERKAKGRVVSLLEGGYSLEGLSRSAAAHVMTLMGV